MPRRQIVATPAGDTIHDEGTLMSLSAISSAPSTALPTVNFHPHGHRKGAMPDRSTTSSASAATSTSSSASGITIGQMPIGASTPLFNNILQSLQQTVGAQVAVTAAPSAAPAVSTAAAAGSTVSTATGAATGTAANVQAFMHSLFQALKQDGLGTGTSTSSGKRPFLESPLLAADVDGTGGVGRRGRQCDGEFERGLSEFGEGIGRGNRGFGGLDRRVGRSVGRHRTSELPREPAAEPSGRRRSCAEQYRQQRERQRLGAGSSCAGVVRRN